MTDVHYHSRYPNYSIFKKDEIEPHYQFVKGLLVLSREEADEFDAICAKLPVSQTSPIRKIDLEKAAALAQQHAASLRPTATQGPVTSQVITSQSRAQQGIIDAEDAKRLGIDIQGTEDAPDAPASGILPNLGKSTG